MSDVIERAEAELEGVSPGPWASYGHGVATVVDHCTCGAGGPHGHEIGCGLEGPVARETAPDDAHFIAAARTLVPELVAELKAARASEERHLHEIFHLQDDLKDARAENEHLRTALGEEKLTEWLEGRAKRLHGEA